MSQGMSAKDRAIDILVDMGHGDREAVMRALGEDGRRGDSARITLAHIEKGIAADRKDRERLFLAHLHGEKT